MSIPFSCLSSLKPGRIVWKVKVIVIRKWKDESSFFRGVVSSIETILLDLDVSLLSMQFFFLFLVLFSLNPYFFF